MREVYIGVFRNITFRVKVNLRLGLTREGPKEVSIEIISLDI